MSRDSNGDGIMYRRDQGQTDSMRARRQLSGELLSRARWWWHVEALASYEGRGAGTGDPERRTGGHRQGNERGDE